MTTPEVKGWCPGALRPMMSGDGLVVRIRPRLARLSQRQAAGLAALSARYGNGLIDLSTRGNVQLRGVQTEGHTPLIDGLRDLGLVDEDATLEARRNITLTPFWQDGDDNHQIAAALEQALAASNAPALPGKFGFAIDCGDTPVLQGVSADIRIERADGILICRADGADTGQRVTAETAASTALDLARWFIGSNGAPDGRGRMANHLTNGAMPPAGFDQIAAHSAAFDAAPTYTAQGQLIGFEFGQITADMLAQLAENAAVRITPWRMILMEQSIAPDIPGLITQGDDPRLKISACTGAPGCPQALSTTRDLARALAPRLNTRAHVSGCAKGCAHPAPCEITLVATAPDCFDLIRNGRASAIPERTNLTPDMIQEAL